MTYRLWPKQHLPAIRPSLETVTNVHVVMVDGIGFVSVAAAVEVLGEMVGGPSGRAFVDNYELSLRRAVEGAVRQIHAGEADDAG